jgi:hypothetical protein
MAPSALQSGSTAVQPLVKVVNGELCMQGLPVMVNGTLRAPKEVSCSAGPKYLSILNGTLGLPDVEDELVLGPAMFAVHRSVDWLYDATLQSFTASVNVSGHLKMVLWDDFTQALATVSPVAVNLTGRLTFTSKDYPGPGEGWQLAILPAAAAVWQRRKRRYQACLWLHSGSLRTHSLHPHQPMHAASACELPGSSRHVHIPTSDVVHACSSAPNSQVSVACTHGQGL